MIGIFCGRSFSSSKQLEELKQQNAEYQLQIASEQDRIDTEIEAYKFDTTYITD